MIPFFFLRNGIFQFNHRLKGRRNNNMQFSILKIVGTPNNEGFILITESRTDVDFIKNTCDTIYDSYAIEIKSGFMTFRKLKYPIKHKDIGQENKYAIVLLCGTLHGFFQIMGMQKITCDITGIETLQYKEEFILYCRTKQSNIVTIKD